MLTVIIYSREKKEIGIIERKVRDNVAFQSDEYCDYHTFIKYENLENFLEENELCDMICFDITGNDGIKKIENIRRHYNDALIMLIINNEISPMEYMKPSIMAASIIIRPADEKSLDSSISMLVEAVCSKHQNEDSTNEAFIVNTDEGKVRIPFSNILYFEAREKKIFVSTETKEYSVYNTLEKLSNELPERFIRCHKSFIVNKNKIYKIAISKNEIELLGERYVPVSRTYKPQIKALQG